MTTMNEQIKVLVVEDHPVAQRMALLILKSLACEVDVATNGKEALELVEKKCYDLIFMDIGLPDIDGMLVTANIRSKGDKLVQIPVIGLTAHASAQMRLDGINAGMNDFLVKPLTKETCLETIKKFVVRANVCDLG